MIYGFEANQLSFSNFFLKDHNGDFASIISIGSTPPSFAPKNPNFEDLAFWLNNVKFNLNPDTSGKQYWGYSVENINLIQ